MPELELCGVEECRLVSGHGGQHNRYPSRAWSFFEDRDRNKITKAGFATPRGGAKGAYQNHVDRSNKVIIPYEFLGQVDLANYQDGYVIRLFPTQYFDAAGVPKAEFIQPGAQIVIGDNAFILYRTHDTFADLPPLAGWEIRYLRRDGVLTNRRGGGAIDHGHYVLRLATLGDRAERSEGPPQGIFATEYADVETNYFSKCVLALMIVMTEGSPYTEEQSKHLKAIIDQRGLFDQADWERRGILLNGVPQCPLCLGKLTYAEFHETISLDEEGGLENAGHQVEGATRSTKLNLFHMRPLFYKALVHQPSNIAWGHAVCNTRLGQRPCYSVAELNEQGRQITLVGNNGQPHDGHMSTDGLMIRSEQGGVWIEIVRECATGEEATTEVKIDASESS